MWYNVNITVKQNKNFYVQKDCSGNLFINSGNPLYKKDLNSYEFIGNLGGVFKSIEKREPKVSDDDFVRYIFGIPFTPYMVQKRGTIFNRKYHIYWTSRQLDTVEKIAEFYYHNLLKQIPNETNIECLKNCLKKALNNKENTE